jgi:signal transduction histidine kinase
MTSLRTRLTVYYTCFFAITLLILGLGTYFLIREALEQGVENDLRAGTHQMMTLYEAGQNRSLSTIVSEDGRVRFEARGELTQLFNNPMLVVQVFGPEGRLVGRSPNLENQQVALVPGWRNLDAGESLVLMQYYDGTRLASQITPLVANIVDQNGVIVDQQIVGILQVTRPLIDVDKTLNLLLLILLAVGGVALLITPLGVTLLSRRALVSIDQVTRTAQGIVNAEDLGQRVPEPNSNDELQRLTVTLNEMLARMERLFVGQRRFVADVSHELRTPLAAMQGNLEILTRSNVRTPELLDETLGDMRRETARLIRMVNDLLLLAQSDSGVELRNEPVEVDTLMLEVYRELRPLANGVTLRIGAEDQVVLNGDRDRLKQALLNLGVNALQHTGPNGSVTLSLERRDGFACLSVADTGEGISPDDLPYIFDRFYRADRSRSRHRGGAGLGLSIVKRIAEAHNGYATVASELHRGSTFAIWLPLDAEQPLLLPEPVSATKTEALPEPVTA